MIFQMHRRTSLIFLFVCLWGCQQGPSTNALIRAVNSNDEATVDALLADGKVDINGADRSGKTALHHALAGHHKQVYIRLLQAGADANQCDYRGSCAVNLAAEESDSFWLRDALQHGGNPNAPNTGNRFSPDSPPLFYAIYAKRVDNVKMLIKAGADVDHRNTNGTTPLKAALEGGTLEIFVVLLEAGADPDKPDNHGYTVRDWIADLDESVLLDKEQVPWFRKAKELLTPEHN